MLFRKKETDRLFTIEDLENLISLINKKRKNLDTELEYEYGKSVAHDEDCVLIYNLIAKKVRDT